MRTWLGDDQREADLQRDVVRNERRQSVEDTPYGIIWEAMAPALYPSDHPYGHTVIGTHEDLMAATVDDVVNFFERWYVPNNASLVVASDFDAVETKAGFNDTSAESRIAGGQAETNRLHPHFRSKRSSRPRITSRFRSP